MLDKLYTRFPINVDVVRVGADRSLWGWWSGQFKKCTAGVETAGPASNLIQQYTVDSEGCIWTFTVRDGNEYAHAGRLMRFVNNAWAEIYGAGGWDICTGPNGAVYLLGSNRFLYRWRGGNEWELMSEQRLRNVAVNNQGQIWGSEYNPETFWHHGSYDLLYWNGNGWIGTGAQATEVIATPVSPHVIHHSQNGHSYIWSGGGWTDLGSQAGHMGQLDADGYFWMAAPDDHGGPFWLWRSNASL